MRPGDLEGHYCKPRLSPDEARHSGIRQRLNRVAIQAGPDGTIFINGDAFRADDFRFLRDNFQCPKPK